MIYHASNLITLIEVVFLIRDKAFVLVKANFDHI